MENLSIICWLGVCVRPGDRLNLTYTDANEKQLLHSEEITRSQTHTCVAVLALPSGIGMIIGTDKLADELNALFPGGQVPSKEPIL